MTGHPRTADRSQALPRPRCPPARAAATDAPSAPPAALLSPPNPLLCAAVEALFKLPPVFASARGKARAMIVERGAAIGLDWAGTVDALRALPGWEARLAAATDTALAGAEVYPDYYKQPFHAYPQGNLNWDAALEFQLSSQSVHAPVMDPANKAMDPQ